MASNNIKEVKSVDAENFDYLLADSNFRIESVFKTRSHKPFEPNVPVTSAPKTQTIRNDSTANFDTDVAKYLPSNIQDTKGSTKFSFTIDGNDYSIYDLRDAEFNIQVQYAYVDSEVSGKKCPVNFPTFGNQCLLSLFQYIELYVDGNCVAVNSTPGMNSNANYALKYPHCKSLEKNYEINGYISTDGSKYSKFNAHNTAADTAIAGFDNQSITLKAIPNAAIGSQTKVFYTGFITQRIKLSDLFSFIKTLPPLYNHTVKIEFQRTSHNYLICNTNTFQNVRCECVSIPKFNLRQDIYYVTDQLKSSLNAAYSKPIETLVTMEKQILTDFMTMPKTGSGTSFNVNVETAYKNKLLTIAIPRTNDLINQYNSCKDRYDLTSNATPLAAYIDNSVVTTHYDTYKAPANSYTYGGIRSLDISTVNGVLLYHFEPEIEGIISGKKTAFRLNKPETQLNFLNGGDAIKCANYEDVYKQYVKARKHFWEEENEALDFDTFLKEYCVYCIDLSPFKLSPNENLRVAIQYSEWTGDYNPYYENNYEHNEDHMYRSTRVICCLYYDKVLKIGNGIFELKPMFDEKNEVETVNMS